MFTHVLALIAGYVIGQLDARSGLSERIYKATVEKLETAKTEPA